MNKKKIEAQVILCRCQEDKSLFGITIEKSDDKNWSMKYSYPIDEKRAKNEGFNKSVIKADIIPDSIYKGCPKCGRKSLVKCGTCGKLTCYSDENSLTCGWCGKHLEDIQYRGAMDITVGVD